MAGDGSTERAVSAVNANEVGFDSRPITWKPFAQLNRLRAYFSSIGIELNQPSSGAEANGMESDQNKSECNDLRHAGHKHDATANTIVDGQCASSCGFGGILDGN